MNVVSKQKLLEFTDNLVMGILNVTPDSFYTESRVASEIELLKRAEQMLTDGADILDVGGYSSRPNATDITIEEEMNRIVPALQTLRKTFPEALISLDTFRSEVARAGLYEGADIINDIGAGLLDKDMPAVIAEFKVPYIIMHMRGTPQTMQSLTHYDHLVAEICTFFSERIHHLQSVGVHDLIIDPGFGFAKTMEQNFEMIQKFALFKMFELPILAGISRKSFIQKALNINVDSADLPTQILHGLLIEKGAQIIRTHDVAVTKQTLELLKHVG